MKKIRVGIIGQGRSGRNIHAFTMQKIPKLYSIVAVSDPLADRQQRAREEFKCDAYASHKDLLKRKDLDLVVNAGPSQLHVPITDEILKAGHDCVCEKPLARKVSEVDKLIRTSKKTKKMLAVFQQNRYQPWFQKMLEVVNSGVLGRIVMVKATASSFARRWDWQTLRKNYGGNLLNTGPHPVDQIIHFIGTDKKPRIACHMDRANTFGDAEDHVKVLIQTPGKPAIDLEISSCCAIPAGQAYNVYGTRGGLIFAGGLKWKYYNPKKQPRRKLETAPLVNAAGDPAYCSDKLTWIEKEWSKPSTGFDCMIAYYKMIHKALNKKGKQEVTLEQIRQQAYIMEECHRQNPASKMPKADVLK